MVDPRIAYRKLWMTFNGPIWAHQPECVQLDTNRACNLSCSYCNVKRGGSYSLPMERMSDDIFKRSVELFVGNRLILSYSPFMNGDPMLEERLGWMVDYAWKVVGCRSSIITNGALWNLRDRLINPHLDVCFTISAATPKTYEKVHGRPGFDDALRTFYWFSEHRKGQGIRLHYITTKDNEGEVDAWLDLFKGYQRRVFPIHESHLQGESERVKTKHFEPYIIGPDNKPVPCEVWSARHPCQCWNTLNIGPRGEIMHCSDMPPEHNYGTIFDTPWKVAWNRRNATRGDHPLCRSCSLRRPDYKKIFDKALGVN